MSPIEQTVVLAVLFALAISAPSETQEVREEAIKQAQDVDPAAYIELSHFERWWFDTVRQIVATNDATTIATTTKWKTRRCATRNAFICAKAKMNSAVREDLRSTTNHELVKSAIRLGSSWQISEPLARNINNYAPDNFSDLEIISLFEVSEQVRLGRVAVDLAKLKTINERLMWNYIKAIVGTPAAVPYNPGDKHGDEECDICGDKQAMEPMVELPCGHLYHEDCAAHWDERHGAKPSTCPCCRKQHRMPFTGATIDSRPAGEE